MMNYQGFDENNQLAMINAFNRLSIKNKLRIIIIFTSNIILLLASSAFIINDLTTFKRNMVADLFVLSDLVGMNSVAGLLFGDTQSTEENILSLKADKDIILAHIFTQSGDLLASYINENADSKNLPNYKTLKEYYLHSHKSIKNDIKIKDTHTFCHNYIDVYKKIIFKGKHLGTVYIRSDLTALNHRLFWAGSILASIFILSLLFSFLLASRFQRIITMPIYSLLETMKKVSKCKIYSLRVEATTEDELGNLIEGFNDMLTQIEKRDIKLNEYRENLEEMVGERTAALTQRTAELVEARDQAMAANKAKSAFLANMSHELRTPLNGVLGYAQILKRDERTPVHQIEGLDIIIKSGEYLLTLISDILDLSKIEAGKIELYPNDFNFHTFLEGIVSLFQMRTHQKNIQFIYNFSSDLPNGVCADEKRLRQIIINLLSNAVKFTENGHVTFNVKRQDKKIRFEIIDTGIGIASEEIEKIFEPFQQAGDKDYRYEGTGLGLAITKTLVEMMGEKLCVNSQINEGSHFWFDVDLAEIKINNEKNKVKLKVIGYENLCQDETNHYDILIVDDKKENRSLIVDLLTPLGFNVSEANNGQMALMKIKRAKPDLIFMDLMMPDMDGFETTRQIRQLNTCQEIIILALSASVFEQHRQASLDAGCNEFLSKPVQETVLLSMLEKYLPLKWVYDEKTKKYNTLSLVEISYVLTKEQAKILHDFARIGDITAIQDYLNELEQEDSQLIPLIQQLRALADEFDIDKIRNFAKQYL